MCVCVCVRVCVRACMRVCAYVRTCVKCINCTFSLSSSPSLSPPLSISLSLSQEGALEDLLQSLATDLAPVYNWLAPDSYKNQLATQMAGQECRLGSGEERPFSGITCCMDFCAHSHYDRQNMTTGGATVVSMFADVSNRHF